MSGSRMDFHANSYCLLGKGLMKHRSPMTVSPRTSYHAAALSLGQRLKSIVAPIRLLSSLRWSDSVRRRFLAEGGRELPRIRRESYRPLTFDPGAKCDEIGDLENDVRRRIGHGDPLGRLLGRRCRQARAAIELLTLRGTPEFARQSRLVYSKRPISDSTVQDFFAALNHTAIDSHNPRPTTFNAKEAAAHLRERLRGALAKIGRFKVVESCKITADAAASGRTIRLRRGAQFREHDIALLEVHEGWVHLGATLNARRQSNCRFLDYGPPAVAETQEGLAVLCELLAGVGYPARLRRLWQRFQAVCLADAGADFRDVYQMFLADSDDPNDSYQQAVRVFRGCLPTGTGAFAKDRAYMAGLMQLLSAARNAISTRTVSRFSWLFVGKVSLSDLPLLVSLGEAGVLESPAFIPPPFQQVTELASALACLPRLTFHSAETLN